MLVCHPLVIGRWSLFDLLLPQHRSTQTFPLFWSISIETPPFLFPAEPSSAVIFCSTMVLDMSGMHLLAFGSWRRRVPRHRTKSSMHNVALR
jgi:hypothetical protein